jgi:hypothetical protein
MNTKENSIKILNSRIESAKKVLALFVQQLQEQPDHAFQLFGNASLQAATEQRIFTMYLTELLNGGQVRTIEETLNRRIQAEIANHNPQRTLMDSITQSARLAALAQVLEILKGA